jgi:hypothetical protein
MQTNPVAQLGNNGCVGNAPAALGSTARLSSAKLPKVAGGDAPSSASDTKDKQERNLVQALTSLGSNSSALFDPKASDDAVNLIINTLVAPFPPAALTSGQKGTSGADDYLAKYNILRARLSMAAEALRFVAADYRPNPAITSDDIQSIAKLVMLDNPPAAPLSHHELISMVVNATAFSNAKWAQWLGTTSEAGAWRAIALMRAIQSEEDERNQALKERLVALMAANQSIRSGDLADDANNTRAEAVDQSVRQSH